MADELEVDVAEMLEDDFPTPIDDGGEVESGGESATTPEGIPTPEPKEEEEEEEEKKVSPEPVVEGTPKEGGEPTEKEGDAAEVKVEGEVIAPEVGGEVSELDALKSQVGTLMNLLNVAHSGGVAPVVPATPGEPEAPMDFATFMEGVDFDKVMDSKDAFMSFFIKSMDVVRKQTEQSVMAAVPQTVEGQIQRANTMREVANEFYTSYPELSQIKGYVANVAAEVSAKNPDWDMNMVLTETAKVTKSMLGLDVVPKAPVTPEDKATPVLSGGTRTSKTPSGKKNAMQEEIEDFLTDF